MLVGPFQIQIDGNVLRQPTAQSDGGPTRSAVEPDVEDVFAGRECGEVELGRIVDRRVIGEIVTRQKLGRGLREPDV